MTEKEFERALRRGLGSAIIELKKCNDKMKYRDIVLRCCLRDITFERIMEGSKGFYLYSAICELSDKNEIEKILIDKFLSKCKDGLFFQLTDILYCCAYYDKSEFSKDAFYKKYEYFADKARFSFSENSDDGRQWNEIAINLFYLDGFSAFKRYVTDVGKMLLKKSKNKAQNLMRIKHTGDWSWLKCRAEGLFGEKKISGFFEKACQRSKEIKALADALREDEALYKLRETEREKEQVTVKKLIEAAKTAVLDKKPYSKFDGEFGFLKNAGESDFLELADTILREEDKKVKALLLQVFTHRKQFPLEITPLLEYVESNNTMLAETAVESLEDFKDKRIHDLAERMIKDKKSIAIGLLRNSYKKSDDEIVNNLIKSVGISHRVQLDIVWIYKYKRRCAARVLPALLRVYRNGECVYCRNGVVEIMHSCGILSDEILNECLYDSYDETRVFANRLIERK